jgi:hypothetical protein
MERWQKWYDDRFQFFNAAETKRSGNVWLPRQSEIQRVGKNRRLRRRADGLLG